MMPAALAVFVIGLRHGADPDHLAAIDNLTRNAHDTRPRTSRFVGTLFAIGHSAMVLAMAALAAFLGSKLLHANAAVESAGSIASIAVLLLMVVLNLVALFRPGAATLRARLLPKALRNASHPLVALPVGAIFGLGFETASQLVAYGAAFQSAHLVDGVLIGAAFCGGMICTDTLDSLFVARVVTTKAAEAVRARRIWIALVSVVALAVAAAKIAELLGYALPLDELSFSLITILMLIGTAMLLLLRARLFVRKSAA